MLRSGWLNLARVVSSEAGNLRSVHGGCATILDSSLRCASFRMTGGGMLCCVQNDRMEVAAFGMAGEEGAAFGMTE